MSSTRFRTTSVGAVVMVVAVVGMALSARTAFGFSYVCQNPGIGCISFSGYSGARVWDFPVDGNGNNCTNYAAFRLSRNGVPNPGRLGDAGDWATKAAGYGFQVDHTPAVGAIAQWNRGSAYAPASGHVAYVESVTATGIEETESNWQGPSRRVRIDRGDAQWPSNFIHFKDAGPLSYRTVSQSVAGPGTQDLSHAFIGERATLNVTVQNTGTATWDSRVRLATDQPQGRTPSLLEDPAWISSNRLVAVAGTVAPGATYTFSVPVTVGGQNPSPQTPAAFTEALTLVDEGVAWFGQSGPVVSIKLTQTIDRGVVFRHRGPGGYALAPDGTITPFGGAPSLQTSAQWPDWSIARGIVLRSDDAGGYVLDGYGGLHPFGNAPALASSTYWSGWDIARAVLLRSDDAGGYILDGYGGLHPFGDAPALGGGPYWSGWDIARAAVLRPDNAGGYVLDGYGGLHPFGNAPALASGSYWGGWDIARSIALLPDGSGGDLLDGYGGLHPFGDAGAPSGVSYWGGTDTAKAVAINGDGTQGADVDEAGAVHLFTP